MTDRIMNGREFFTVNNAGFNRERQTALDGLDLYIPSGSHGHRPEFRDLPFGAFSRTDFPTAPLVRFDLVSGLTLGGDGNGVEIAEPIEVRHIAGLMALGGAGNHEAVARMLAGKIGDVYSSSDEIRNVSVTQLANGDYRIDFQHVHSDFDFTGPVTYKDDYSVILDFDYDATATDSAPSAPILSGSTVAENASGAVIGTLSSQDEDGDPITFTVDDQRFEVDGNQLKLKDGVQLDYATEQNVRLIITASDSAGRSVWSVVEISVTDVAEDPDPGTE